MFTTASFNTHAFSLGGLIDLRVEHVQWHYIWNEHSYLFVTYTAQPFVPTGHSNEQYYSVISRLYSAEARAFCLLIRSKTNLLIHIDKCMTIYQHIASLLYWIMFNCSTVEQYAHNLNTCQYGNETRAENSIQNNINIEYQTSHVT